MDWSGLLRRLEPNTLRWISYCTVVMVEVAAVFTVAVFGLTKNEQGEFRCYATISSQPIRVKAIEVDCYQKYDHQYNKVSPVTLMTCVWLFQTAVLLVTFVYTRYASHLVKERKDKKYGLFKAYVCQLVARSLILVVLLCLQWTVMTSISFPEEYTCRFPTQPDHGSSHNITELAANANKSTRYSCGNRNAIAKSVSGGFLFGINLLASLCSVGETADLIRSWYKEWPSDKHFCAKYQLGKRGGAQERQSVHDVNEQQELTLNTGSAPGPNRREIDSEGTRNTRNNNQTGNKVSVREKLPKTRKNQVAAELECNKVPIREKLPKTRKNQVAAELECSKVFFRKKLPQTVEEKVAELESMLKNEYRSRESTYVTPFPWLEGWQLALDKIFIQVRMFRRDSQRSGGLRGEERGMYDIFEPHELCEEPRIVLVEGACGIGKTVFCQKIATDWSKGHTGESFPNFRIVLNLKCRDIQSTSSVLDRKALEDSIVDQLLPPDAPEKLKTALFEYMKTDQCQVLLVLDGLDKFKVAVRLDDLRRQLRSWHCKFLFTSRNDPKLRKSCDSVYEIVGFTSGDAVIYINKFFGQDGKKMAASLVSKIKDGQLPGNHVRNPLHCSLVCFVFNKKDGELPSSNATLHEELACVLRQEHEKNGQEPLLDPLAAHQEDLAFFGCFAQKRREEQRLERMRDANVRYDAQIQKHVAIREEKESTRQEQHMCGRNLETNRKITERSAEKAKLSSERAEFRKKEAKDVRQKQRDRQEKAEERNHPRIKALKTRQAKTSGVTPRAPVGRVKRRTRQKCALMGAAAVPTRNVKQSQKGRQA